jgi:hypothetical protein
MANDRNNIDQRNLDVKRGENSSSIPNDLPDNERDRAKLEGEETIMDLPDVKDIPGQEFVHAPVVGEMGDTTISSADEEGANIIGLNDDDGDANDSTSGAGGNISRDERRTLTDDNYIPTRDENNLRQARMDNVDFEGEPLNEGSFGTLQTEKDLDIPGSGNERRIDSMSQSDEENKGYSVDDTDNSESSENRSGA